jgi:hypothetical protein
MQHRKNENRRNIRLPNLENNDIILWNVSEYGLNLHIAITTHFHNPEGSPIPGTPHPHHCVQVPKESNQQPPSYETVSEIMVSQLLFQQVRSHSDPCGRPNDAARRRLQTVQHESSR